MYSGIQRVVLPIFLLILISACENESYNQQCVEPTYFVGDTNRLLEQPPLSDSLSQSVHALWYREKVFIPSAFTPNNDAINDSLLTSISLQSGDYSAIQIIQYAGNIVHVDTAHFESYHAFLWAPPQGVLTPRLCDVTLDIQSTNQQIVHHYSSQFWILQPDANARLPHWATCLIFADQYDSRFGLAANPANYHFPNTTQEQFN
ncbi:MAG: hypothetical protein RLZZ543_820 [Bacteroidota bacterium]|jgi:hypothetical protein